MPSSSEGGIFLLFVFLLLKSNQNTLSMTRLFICLLLLGSVSLAHAQFDIEDKLAEKAIQGNYVTFLTGKGYSPEVDSDGDIKFTYNERIYYITIDSEEKSFFRIARLAGLELSTEEEITKAKKICHDITKDTKVAKVYWLKNTLWVSSEIILDDSQDYMGIFDRVMTLTESAYVKFVELWKAS